MIHFYVGYHLTSFSYAECRWAECRGAGADKKEIRLTYFLKAR